MKKELVEIDCVSGEKIVPYKWPAKFNKFVDSGGNLQYVCEVAIGYPDMGKMVIVSERPDAVCDQVEKEIDLLLSSRSNRKTDRVGSYSL